MTSPQNPAGASSPVPPPFQNLPFVSLHGSQGFLTNTAIEFLQTLWAALQGQGGTTDITTLTLPQQGQAQATAAALARDEGMAAALEIAAQPQRSPPVGALPRTWTPVLAGATTAGAQTYASRSGLCIDIGPVTLILFSLTLSAFDATTGGQLIITGLPLQVASLGPSLAAWTAQWGGLTLTAGYTQVAVEIASGAASFGLYQCGSAHAAAVLGAGAALSNTSQIDGGAIVFRAG